MANASPMAVRVGWELYRQSGFEAPQDELNEQLVQRGLDPISPRTYNHDRSLARAGYDHYVSINRFDVARAARPFEGVTASNIYAYLDASLAVRATFVRFGEPFVAEGRTTQISEVGAVVRFDDKDTASALRQLRIPPGDYVQLEFGGRETTIGASHAKVIGPPEYEPGGGAVFETEFIRLQTVSDFVPSRALAEQLTTIRLRTEDGVDASEITLDVVGRRVYYLLEALELSRH